MFFLPLDSLLSAIHIDLVFSGSCTDSLATPTQREE